MQRLLYSVSSRSEVGKELIGFPVVWWLHRVGCGSLSLSLKGPLSAPRLGVHGVGGATRGVGGPSRWMG